MHKVNNNYKQKIDIVEEHHHVLEFWEKYKGYSEDNYKEDIEKFEKFEKFTTDEVMSICVLTSGNDIRTKEQYFLYFNSYKSKLPKDDAIVGIILKDKYLLIKRMSETLERFGIENL